jgi:predicted nucleic acid-binding protein
VAALIDTNILVYRYDPRFAKKQKIAKKLLRQGIKDNSVRLAHQTIVEFVAVASRPAGKGIPTLSIEEARREAEELLLQFTVLYPSQEILRMALRGAASYGLSWFDAHMWAYAEHYGLERIYSEDFQHNRIYGSVRVVNPFLQK